jgi:hypothetical protein
MRRAVLILALLAAFPLSARAAKPEGPVDAVGMLDFKKGRFKVGDWVRYRTVGNSAQGYRTDYTVTVLIAGEELWWGEECFWVETHTAYSGGKPEITASLISFSVFEDSLPSRRFARYLRKYLDGVDAEGKWVQTPFQRAGAEITNRAWEEYEPVRKVDTLGVEPVTVPKGTFQGLKVWQFYKEYTNRVAGDSTVYFELTEDHTTWWSKDVPLTSFVKQTQENTQRRRTWLLGNPENVPLNVVELATGGTELLDFGGGMKALAIAERFQRPLGEQRAAQQSKRPPAAKRPAGKRG